MHFARSWPSRDSWILTIVLVLGFVVRFAPALLHPNVIHPDETVQYFEQANRAVTGNGYVPWEYMIGARSWLMPGMLIPVMWLCKIASVSPIGLFAATRAFASALSLACVVSAFYLGRRVGGSLSGLVTATFVALWPEITVMSAHFLADTVCVIPLLLGLVFGYRKDSSSLQLFCAGLAWGLVVVLRPQLAPAIVVAGFWIANIRWERYVPIVLGGIVPLLISGALDYLTWGQFFASTVRYVQVNSSGVADAFGKQPYRQYLTWEARTWGFGIPLIGLTALIGTRKLPLLAVMAAVTLLTFSLVGHKEARFVYPAIPLIFILCGVGTTMIWHHAQSFSPRAKLSAAIALPLFWFAGAADAQTSKTLIERASEEEPILRAFKLINQLPDVCGVGLNRPDEWWRTAHAYLPAGADIYPYERSASNKAVPFNALLMTDQSMPRKPLSANGFGSGQCFEGNVRACVFYRHSPCGAGKPVSADPLPEVEAILRRLGYQ